MADLSFNKGKVVGSGPTRSIEFNMRGNMKNYAALAEKAREDRLKTLLDTINGKRIVSHFYYYHSKSGNLDLTLDDGTVLMISGENGILNIQVIPG